MRWLQSKTFVVLAVALSATPAFSQTANFGEFKLSTGFSAGQGQALTRYLRSPIAVETGSLVSVMGQTLQTTSWSWKVSFPN